MSIPIEKSTLAKDENGSTRYIYPATTADMVYYDEPDGVTVKEKLDELMEEMEGMTYEAIAINTFTATPAYIEKGGIITSIKFDFEFNRLPRTIQIKIGSATYDVTNTAETYTVTGLNIKEAAQCSITVYDNKNGYASKSLNLALRRRYFYGTAQSFTKLTDLTATTSASKSMSLNVNAASGQYIFICVPISNINDSTTFNVGGFEGGFSLLGVTEMNTSCQPGGSINISNNGTIKELSASNIKNTDSTSGSTYSTTQTYAVYKSDNAGLGNTTIKIS